MDIIRKIPALKHWPGINNLLMWKNAAAFLTLYNNYQTRVEADSGTVQSSATSKEIFKILEDNDLYDNTRLLIAAEGGIKTRTSGVNVYCPKAYDFGDSDNDAVQTTEASQPAIGGNIAPNELQCFKNVNGESRTFTHPSIVVSGTYTIIKVLNAESSGKTEITFTEVNSGTYNSIAWTGKNYLYAIIDKTIAAGVQTTVAASLRALYPEIPSVQIGTQTWATSNFEAVATPMGNVIQEMQANAAVEKITNVADREFSSDTGFWIKGTGWTISGGKAIQDGTSDETVTSWFRINSLLTVGKWYKISLDVDAISGKFNIVDGSVDLVSNINTIGSKVYYAKATSTILALDPDAGTTMTIDNVSVEQLGWADSQELYDGLIAQGESVQTALEAASMWCYYNNDPVTGTIYGKLYNWFAVKLLQTDIDTYNASNPDWGWHCPTDAELGVLQSYLGGSAIAGKHMKALFGGFNNSYADNSSGLSLLPSGRRNGDGSFAYITTYTYMQSIDGTYLNAAHNTDAAHKSTFSDLRYGLITRLIKD